jgi:hypothetical protein
MERIVAGAAVEQRAVMAGDQRVVAVLAVEPAGQHSAVDQIVARSGIDVRDRGIALVVVAGVKPDAVVESGQAEGFDRVIAFVLAVRKTDRDSAAATCEDEGVGAEAAIDGVGAEAAVEQVVAPAAFQPIVAVAAVEDIVAVPGAQDVAAGAAVQRIGAGTADDDVGAVMAEHGDAALLLPIEYVVQRRELDPLDADERVAKGFVLRILGVEGARAAH